MESRMPYNHPGVCRLRHARFHSTYGLSKLRVYFNSKAILCSFSGEKAFHSFDKSLPISLRFLYTHLTVKDYHSVF